MINARRLFLGISTALLTVGLAACSGSGAVVTVDGQAITHAQLDTQLESSPTAKQALQNLVVGLLVDDYAKKNNITVTNAEIQKVVGQYEKQYPSGEFEQLLAARGMTMTELQDLVRRQLVIQKALGKNVHVSEAQVAAYFQKNHAAFDTPEMVKAKHILVPDLKTAQLVEADLKKGGDFAALAKQYSVDPGSKAKGGELGWFRKGQMVPAFEKAAFSQKIGTVSAPVKSPFGYHIIVVEDRKPAVKATLASAHDQIVNTLTQQQIAPLEPGFIQSLQQQAKININDPVFAGLFPSPAPPAAAQPAATTVPAPKKK